MGSVEREEPNLNLLGFHRKGKPLSVGRNAQAPCRARNRWSRAQSRGCVASRDQPSSSRDFLPLEMCARNKIALPEGIHENLKSLTHSSLRLRVTSPSCLLICGSISDLTPSPPAIGTVQKVGTRPFSPDPDGNSLAVGMPCGRLHGSMMLGEEFRQYLTGLASVKTYHIESGSCPKDAMLSGTRSASRLATNEGNIRKMRSFFPILHRPTPV